MKHGKSCSWCGFRIVWRVLDGRTVVCDTGIFVKDAAGIMHPHPHSCRKARQYLSERAELWPSN